MRNLKVYRSGRPGLADLLPWATLVDSGLVGTKKGSFLAGYYFRPPDAASGTDEQAEHISARVNEALLRFGTGWASWTDVISIPAEAYPPASASHFPDPISRMIDEERRRGFEAEGAHFENDRVIVLCYTPPLKQVSRLQDLFYEDSAPDKKTAMQRISEGFEKAMQQFEDQIGTLIGLRRMQSYKVVDDFGREHLQDELVNYLHYCATGRSLALMLPAAGAYLDSVIGGQEMHVGETPIIGEDYVACVVIDGFPAEHTPNITVGLNTLPMAYRFSQRMIYLDTTDAVREIGHYRRKWGQKVRGFVSIIFNSKSGPINEHALRMRQDTEAAVSEAESGMVRFGWYSATIVLRNRDFHELQDMARAVVRTIHDCGFGARIESTNTVEAWLGALPGETVAQVRRPLIHTLNAADLLPLSGVWTGQNSAPCPYYPQPSPPLMHAATVGGIPFRLNLHVGDVGHTLIYGPTGMGKSTLTNALALQGRRYPGMQIWAFDNKRGMMATAKACGGLHYELGGGDTPALCPLARLDTEADQAWAQDLLATCFELQTEQAPNPDQRTEIHLAVKRLIERPGHRSMTDFVLACQDIEVRKALSFYTLEGPAGWLLDAREDAIATSDFNVFETIELMELKEPTSLPVLLTLFRRFERALDGRPSLLFIAEAWQALGHKTWGAKIRGWLKLLRSKNCAVIMDTQSLSDAFRSGLIDVLNESCPTKIYLPNPEALKRGTPEQPGPWDFYRMSGLNDNQIEIIRTAHPKRDYYLVSPEGCRLFNPALGPAALAFAGATGETDVKEINRLEAQHGTEWPFVHLANKGVNHAELV